MRVERAWQNKTAWKLYKENWKLCREVVALRDGKVCQIPDCEVREGLQLDHVFSRDIKRLFFDLNNLGYLCDDHHTHKSFRKGQWVDKIVNDICRRKAGKSWWDFAIVESKIPLGCFRTVWYQQETNETLKEQLKYYKKRTE